MSKKKAPPPPLPMPDPAPVLMLAVTVPSGTDISDAARAAIDLARRLDVCVEFTFNAVRIFVRPTSRPTFVVLEYRQRCIDRKTHAVIA